MVEIDNVKVYDLKESIIACRNAFRTSLPEYTKDEFEESLKRAKSLASSPAGSGHQNFLKGVRVSFDIIYPNYISPELQRYNWMDIVTSSSKMHCLLCMDIDKACNKYVSQTIVDQVRKDIADWNAINGRQFGKDCAPVRKELRGGDILQDYDKGDALYHAFMTVVSDCPQGIELFMRVSTNYLQLKTVYRQRRNHKLREDWGAVCKMIESLPYSEDFLLK